ncbi:hypothetical protein GCM10023219_26580 [Stakelama sediminis]
MACPISDLHLKIAADMNLNIPGRKTIGSRRHRHRLFSNRSRNRPARIFRQGTFRTHADAYNLIGERRHTHYNPTKPRIDTVRTRTQHNLPLRAGMGYNRCSGHAAHDGNGG